MVNQELASERNAVNDGEKTIIGMIEFRLDSRKNTSLAKLRLRGTSVWSQTTK